MYEGFPVELQMERIFTPDGVFEEGTYHCKIVGFEEDGDYVTLHLQKGDLTSISLDAKYRCYINTGEEILQCTGIVYERYQNKGDNVLTFKIENGFYLHSHQEEKK